MARAREEQPRGGAGRYAREAGAKRTERQTAALLLLPPKPLPLLPPNRHRFGSRGHAVCAGRLAQRFAVVGLLEQLQKSTCLISIDLHGTVPTRCNCTGATAAAAGAAAAGAAAAGAEAGFAAAAAAGGQRGKAGAPHSDHGVSHHGGTAVLTRRERAAAESLTVADRALYAEAVSVFWEAVRHTERRYGFELC